MKSRVFISFLILFTVAGNVTAMPVLIPLVIEIENPDYSSQGNESILMAIPLSEVELLDIVDDHYNFSEKIIDSMPQVSPGETIPQISRDPDREIAEYTEAIRLYPDDGYFYFHRGLAYLEKGEIDKAIADFEEAIRLEPDRSHYYSQRGNAYFKKGEVGKANADFETASRLDLNRQRDSSGLEYFFIP
jgi:tetratricopeptide (TPR) repeat protein